MKNISFTSWGQLGLGVGEYVYLDPIKPIWIKLDLNVQNLTNIYKSFNISVLL